VSNVDTPSVVSRRACRPARWEESWYSNSGTPSRYPSGSARP
jgi:hypothetical protein